MNIAITADAQPTIVALSLNRNPSVRVCANTTVGRYVEDINSASGYVYPRSVTRYATINSIAAKYRVMIVAFIGSLLVRRS